MFLWVSFVMYRTKCGKNIQDTLGYASFATFFSSPHFDVIFDLVMNRRTSTWIRFVKQTNEVKKTANEYREVTIGNDYLYL